MPISLPSLDEDGGHFGIYGRSGIWFSLIRNGVSVSRSGFAKPRSLDAEPARSLAMTSTRCPRAILFHRSVAQARRPVPPFVKQPLHEPAADDRRTMELHEMLVAQFPHHLAHRQVDEPAVAGGVNAHVIALGGHLVDERTVHPFDAVGARHPHDSLRRALAYAHQPVAHEVALVAGDQSRQLAFDAVQLLVVGLEVRKRRFQHEVERAEQLAAAHHISAFDEHGLECCDFLDGSALIERQTHDHPQVVGDDRLNTCHVSCP